VSRPALPFLHTGPYTALSVDYILFLTANVDVTPNINEIRDYKYVDREELQKMFDDSGESKKQMIRSCTYRMEYISKFLYSLVQADCPRLPLWLVGRAAAT
jgi:hypothetical protein